MRRSEQERLAELQAGTSFQLQTLQTIRVVAEQAPPGEAQRPLRAIHDPGFTRA